MPKVKLPQPIGVRIEAARAYGISGTELTEILRSGDFNRLKNAVLDDWTWDSLFEYAASRREECEEAILHGYSFTFITIRGLKTYLKYRFGLVEDQDFSSSEYGVEQLRLNQEELVQLRETIPDVHWHIVVRENVAVEGKSTVDIVLKSPGLTTF
ncbi:hypothetical protein HZF08_14335 [Paenibacillus sp. CGMCC 1.16610]|uniref:Uncharacterized protein n=1 Tax=Paenibacillus anseongense TaxID=2682845 RepID=A0ABW9UG59_9BACL|nr:MULTISPECIES: hypothetical protein [Paenibacillus]MBA2939490.1 hypothetical protein [Paenibacillus sp. CGMCC 1.16610]MVQ39154.1 hypothetical protein [Paenibacillus anseongense]